MLKVYEYTSSIDFGQGYMLVAAKSISAANKLAADQKLPCPGQQPWKFSERVKNLFYNGTSSYIVIKIEEHE